MNTKTPVELRRAPRKRASHPMPVTDVISDQLVGHLGNLSATGMMLIGARAPISEALYQVSLALPGRDGRDQKIEVGIQEQWSETAGTPGQYWAGYRIVAISDDDNNCVEEWLAVPGETF